MSTKMTTDDINKKMKQIFKTHRVRLANGDEAFWEAMATVRKKSPKDAATLRRLNRKWEASV